MEPRFRVRAARAHVCRKLLDVLAEKTAQSLTLEANCKGAAMCAVRWEQLKQPASLPTKKSTVTDMRLRQNYQAGKAKQRR